MDPKKKRELKKIINILKGTRGRHTELISVYIPAGYDIIKIYKHLAEEQHTASNIKDKRTKQNVIDSLERIIRHLKLFKKIPENGLAAFAGNVSEKESQINIEVFSIEPPEPLNVRLYRCDQSFVTDILEDMMDEVQTYGLLVIDKREATLGVMRGKNITVIASFTSDVPGKTTKGGQSQQRYARIREEAAHAFYKRIANSVNDEFAAMEELKGFILGGPGMTKEEFLAGDYLQTRLKERVLGTKDLSYTGDYGLKELVEKSQDLLAEEALVEEKKIMERFFNSLSTKGGGKAAYKEEDVMKALKLGAVDVLLISEDIEDEKLDDLEQKAEAIGAKVYLISLETMEGQQLKELGGLAAILRYKV
jgi:peptide chain release factor subunit 1